MSEPTYRIAPSLADLSVAALDGVIAGMEKIAEQYGPETTLTIAQILDTLRACRFDIVPAPEPQSLRVP
jgi:hypothetical protein